MSPTARAAYASVRVFGDLLDPLDVTRALRLPPDRVYRNGEPRIARRRDGLVHEGAPYQQGLWAMCSERWVGSTELDVHIRWLLDQLEPRAAELQRLLEAGASGGIFCHSAGTSEQATALPSQTLGRCVALSLPVQIAPPDLDEEE
jgi:hypothetical protein